MRMMYAQSRIVCFMALAGSFISLAATAVGQSGIPSVDVRGPIGLTASFDQGLHADTAGGNPRAFAHDLVRLDPDGHAGSALRIEPLQFLRYSIPGNLSMERGTVSMWIAPDRHIKPGIDMTAQNRYMLWSIRDRLDDWMALELNLEKADKPMIRAAFSNDDKTYAFAVMIDDWPAGQWRQVSMSWERPNKAAIKVGDGKWLERDIVPLPQRPDALAYDIYIGSGATQSARAPTGKPYWFEGRIDDVFISPDWQATSPPANLPPGVIEKPAAKLTWATDQPERVQIYLERGPVDGPWTRRPVRAFLNLGEAWADQSPAQRRASLRGLRLFQQDPQTGQVVPREGEATDAHPFKFHEDGYSVAELDLRFVHEGELPAVYALYYDAAAPENTTHLPDVPVMVGNGDRLREGRPSSLGLLNGPLRGSVALFDPDQDGDLDLWMASGDQLRSGDAQSGGHFFYENIGGPGHHARFAPPVKIHKGNSPVGYIQALNAPQIVDVNQDGKLDMFLYNNSDKVQWWEWSFVNGRVVVDAYHELPCPDATRSERGRLLDWNGDGQLDLLAGTSLFFGKQKAGQVPTFGDKPDVTLAIDSIQADAWQSTPLAMLPVDLDGDGTLELIASGWQTRLFVHRKVAGDDHYDSGTRLTTFDGHELRMPSVFPVPQFADFDNDSDLDMVWTNDGSIVGWCENIAGPGRTPMLRQTTFFFAYDAPLTAGCIAIPWADDWDDDGDLDLILGDAGEHVYLAENVGSAQTPIWDTARPMHAAGLEIEIRSGDEGSLLGSQESDWGYTNPLVADWDRDGLDDLIVSGIRGEIYFYRNVGEIGRPMLGSGRLIEFDKSIKNPPTPEWTRYQRQGREVIIAHRCRPAVYDWNKDGFLDLLTLDHTSRWAVYFGKAGDDGIPVVSLPDHDVIAFDDPFALALIWNRRPLDHKGWRPHYAGRTVAQLTDWDGDGDPDLYLDGVNARRYENVTGDPAIATNRPITFVDQGDMADLKIVKHNSGPFVDDLTGDGREDLLVGAQSGRLFFFSREYLEGASPLVGVSAIEVRGAK